MFEGFKIHPEELLGNGVIEFTILV